jgi:hypothetical protein
MKRKQMVERIYDLLNCDGVLEYSMPKLEPVPLTEEHVRWIAEQIVQEVEQSGMLPPLNDWSFYTDGFKADADDVRYYTWETEDDLS